MGAVIGSFEVCSWFKVLSNLSDLEFSDFEGNLITGSIGCKSQSQVSGTPLADAG